MTNEENMTPKEKEYSRKLKVSLDKLMDASKKGNTRKANEQLVDVRKIVETIKRNAKSK